MTQPVVLDLETQHSFREIPDRDVRKLKISLAGLYDYATDKYYAFEEHQLSKLFPFLENASAIIGFNSIDFDLEVLHPYYVGDVHKFISNDLLVHVQKSLGFRVSLDDLAKETLGTQKTGHGLLAIEYFREKQMDKLREYCLSDVKITKELYEYGKKHGKVFFKSAAGRREIPVSWNIESVANSSTINLTLPW